MPLKLLNLLIQRINVKIALSLHSCFEDTRNKLMPINQKYSLKENLAAVRYYAKKTETRITFEYVMLKILMIADDVNALVKICKEIPVKTQYNSI